MTRLHRSYEPLRHPRAARPLPRGSPVERRRPPPQNFPHRTTLPIHACSRHDPGGLTGCIHRSLRQPCQPSPEFRPGRHPQSLFRDRLNVHDPLPPACSQNHPLGDPLLRRLRSRRYLHNRSNGYRLKRPSAGWVCLPLSARTFPRRTELESRGLRFLLPEASAG